MISFISVAIFISQINFPTAEAAKEEEGLTSKGNYWYGPSYRPSWWKPEFAVGTRQGGLQFEDTNSATTWAKRFSECGGSMQSPIEVGMKNLKRKKTKEPLTWINYSNPPKTMVLENSRYSIHGNAIWDKTSDIPYITNGPLGNRYFFSQFHFHWGSDSTKGSEHTINNKRFPMEMHVVHDNPTSQDNSTQLVVVGFMFQISEKDNLAIDKILNGIKDVQGNTEKKTFVQPFPFDCIINTFGDNYVTYEGSLTTPPCSEGVIWILSLEPLLVSERQMVKLRQSVRNERGITIQNFRPLQALNGRDLYLVKK